MNLTLSQWIAWLCLDMLIKAALVISFGMLVTLGAAPIVVFLNLAIFMSVVHFACVFLGAGAAQLLDLFHPPWPAALRWAVAFLVAHATFLCLCAMSILKTSPSAGRHDDGLFLLALATTIVASNLVPFLIVIAVGCAVARLRRSFSRIASIRSGADCSYK